LLLIIFAFKLHGQRKEHESEWNAKGSVKSVTYKEYTLARNIYGVRY